MMYYLEPNYQGASRRVYRIDGTFELLKFAVPQSKDPVEFLAGVVANLIDRVVPDDQDKLDLLGLHAYSLTTDPDEEVR